MLPLSLGVSGPPSYPAAFSTIATDVYGSGDDGEGPGGSGDDGSAMGGAGGARGGAQLHKRKQERPAQGGAHQNRAKKKRLDGPQLESNQQPEKNHYSAAEAQNIRSANIFEHARGLE